MSDDRINLNKHLGPGEQEAVENLMLRRIIHSVNQSLEEGDIAEILGVQLQAVKKTLQLIPKLDASLIEGRDEATQAMVAQLYRAAMGGYVTTKIEEKVTAKGGKTVTITTEEAKPDPSLIKFWLCCVDPERWKSEGDLRKARKRRGSHAASSQVQSDSVARFAEKILGADPDKSA